MKKLLLFLCALTCSAAMSAKTIYLNTGGGNLWEQAGATFKESISDKAMTAVPNVAVGTYYVEIDDTQATVHFQRMSSDGKTVWNQTADLSIPADKNLYTITGWNANDGAWSVYVEEVIDPSTAVYEIKHGWKDGNSWSYKTLNKNEDGTYSLRDIYGGTGCNWKSTYTGEKWIANPTLVGEPQKGDSAIFTLTSTEGDGAITITKIDNGEDPIDPIDPSEKVYVVTGGDTSIFGAEWTENSACTLEKLGDGSYAWTKTDVTLAAGNVEYKMLEKGTWSGWQLPAQGNASFTIDKSGTYDLTFTLSADLSTQNVVTTLKEEVEVLPVVRLMGSLTDWGDGLVLTPSDDKLTASGVVSLEAKEYEMKIRVDGGWYGNAGTMDRGNCTGWVFETTVESNAKITADVAGNYTFVWTYATNSLSVIYPQSTSFEQATSENTATKIIRNGQVLIIRDGVTYDMMGQEVK